MATTSHWRIAAQALLCSAPLLLAACGGSDDPAPLTPAPAAPTPAPPPPPPAAIAPTITAQPAAVSVTEGQTAAFSVTATGTAPLAYQWRRNGADIAGAAAATYSLAATLADNGASFAVVVSNSAGSVTSGAATLTVTAQSTPPSITAQPAAVGFTAGGSASFTVAATGSPAPSYRWLVGGTELNDGAGSGALAGATIAGAATPTLTLTNLPGSAAGAQFAVRVSNAAGTVTSNAAALSLSNVITQVVSAAAGGSVRAGGDALLIEIPAGALDSDATFTLAPATTIADFAPEFREVPGALWNLTITGGKLLPGQTARVRFRVDPGSLTARAMAADGGQVRALTAPGGDGAGWTVVRCENGPPRVVIGERADNDWSSPVAFCESGSTTTGAIGLVLNRTPAPGTTMFDVALGGALAGIRNWTWAGVDAAGQVTLVYNIRVPIPGTSNQGNANYIARFSAGGAVQANVRVPGDDPMSTSADLWPRLVPYALAPNGALAGLWRGASGIQHQARVEAYGVAPFGSGRLLTQRGFARTFSVPVPADDTTPMRALDFAPNGELAVHEWTRLNLYRNGQTPPRLSQVFGIDFPSRPAGAGDGAPGSNGNMALDAAGNVYKVGLNTTNNSGSAFCSPGCPSIYKYSATGQPLWFRVLAAGGAFFGPSVAIDPLGRPVVRYQDSTGRDLITRLDPANGDITGGVDLGRLAFSNSLNTLTFDALGNTFAGVGRYLARIGPDFSAGSVVLLEFGQGQTGDFRAIGADNVGNAYGIFTRGANTFDPEFRLIKLRYP
jgi:hypothetical protein